MATYRVPVFWAGSLTNGGGLSNFFFNSLGGTTAQAVTAVVDFLNSTEDRRHSSCTWSCGQDIDTIDTATGALIGTDNFTPATGTGTNGGQPNSPATQGLLRITTGTVVGGRLLRGRLFLPATTENDNDLGAPTSTYVSDYDAAATTMLGDPDSAWVVWSKTHGVQATVTGESVWNKWAVLRSRRD